MTMNPQSAKTLIWTAGILLVLGLMIPAPAGSLFLFAIAGLCALVPTILARKGTQIAAAVTLILSIALVAMIYPQYQQHMSSYVERAKAGKR